MNNDYTVTLHIGRHSKASFDTRFKMSAVIKANRPYKVATAMIEILDYSVLKKTGLELVIDINGVFIPNDFTDKGYTVEEAYNHAMRTDVDLFLDMLKDALTGEHNND